MRAVVYTETGPSSVLSLVERPDPEPGPGEVRVRLERAGVNPTDWKSRSGTTGGGFDEVVPGQDGAGVVDAVGDGVTDWRAGDRCWVYLAQHQRPYGTAAELTVQPAAHLVRLPSSASFDLGASLGVPAVTAHRVLTSGDQPRLGPGALAGATVLVAGGAGAVGNAAIQLAAWSGATVISTVSSDSKGALATAAGAHHVVDYRALGHEGTVAAVRELAPDGVDLVAEVAPAQNLGLDLEVVRNGATVGYYANNGGDEMTLPVRGSFSLNLRLQGVLLYSVAPAHLAAAADDITAAIEAGSLRVGDDAGLPLHHYPLAETAAAHQAVEDGAVGKVIIDCQD